MYGVNLRGKRGVIYARYSSMHQREASIEDQVRRCLDSVKDHDGDPGNLQVLSDSAMSGTSAQRPKFEELVRLVEQKKIDFIVTEDVSRLSRDIADAAKFFKLLEYQRIPLISVADGIDTSAKGSKLIYTMKAVMADEYIEQLRDKTLRGLEGRFRAGLSAGGLPLGFKSEPVTDPFGKCIGHQVLIDEGRASVVRRIFDMYRSGLSYVSIAKQLHTENVSPPRRWRNRKPGWTPETVRAILHNRSYIGEFKYKQREWRKVPDGKQRRPMARAPEDVITRSFPERRIIDEQMWNDVQERLASVRTCYTKTKDGAPKGRTSSGKQNSYILSGLLRCGLCGSSMTIHAGTSARYYRCAAEKKRGTCVNSLSLREDVARPRILGAVLERLRSKSALEHMRRRVALRLGELSRSADADLRERRERLSRIEQKIAGLVDFISGGERSEYISASLKDLEAHAAVEKRAIHGLVERAEQPVELPPPEFFIQRAARLSELFEMDALRGREALQKFWKDGELRVYPQLDGYYLAEGRYSSLAVLSIPLGPDTTKAPLWRGLREDLWSKVSCAGRI